MGEIARIVDQLDRAWQGPAWHGPEVLLALAGVTASQAAARPIRAAHSIWELVHHLYHAGQIVLLRKDAPG